MTIRIAMWSGPRNISTAMMRAWSSRADTVVMDEPFYAAYLATTGIDHPMREEILATQSTDWAAVAAACAGRDNGDDSGDDSGGIVYQKHMTKHMIAGAPLDWMAALHHAFLIRPPAEVAASYRARWDSLGAEDLGFARQAELFDRVCDRLGAAPPVVEGSDVLANPEGMLRALCAAFGVAFDPAMLSWQRGPHPSDGIWGAHWYEAVNRSTGFAAPRPAVAPGDIAGETADEIRAIVDACRPHYERLAAHRLKPA